MKWFAQTWLAVFGLSFVVLSLVFFFVVLVALCVIYAKPMTGVAVVSAGIATAVAAWEWISRG